MGQKELNPAATDDLEKTLQRAPREPAEKTADRQYMSVREMGDLLGLKKTDRYWLLHKGFFETRSVAGKTWIDVASFEKWYANQVKYHKITGEEPGKELKARSYSPRDISEILGICEQWAYELIRKNKIETITVDYRMRIPREAFQRWYESQSHYMTAEDQEKKDSLIAASVSMPEMARILGTTRQKVYAILKDPQYQHCFDIIVVGGRRRITRESLQHFMDGQDLYRPVTERIENIRKVNSEDGNESCASGDMSGQTKLPNQTAKLDNQNMEYLILHEAAELAGMSRQALIKYIDSGQIIGAKKHGGKFLVPKQEFGNWMIRRMLGKEEATDGIDQETR